MNTQPNNTVTVDAEALRRARQGVPDGEYHVDAEALRRARQGTPTGEYHVDAEALRRARQGTPTGEYHHRGLHLHPVVRHPGRCWKCHGRHATANCPIGDDLPLLGARHESR